MREAEEASSEHKGRHCCRKEARKRGFFSGILSGDLESMDLTNVSRIFASALAIETSMGNAVIDGGLNEQCIHVFACGRWVNGSLPNIPSLKLLGERPNMSQQAD